MTPRARPARPAVLAVLLLAACGGGDAAAVPAEGPSTAPSSGSEAPATGADTLAASGPETASTAPQAPAAATGDPSGSGAGSFQLANSADAGRAHGARPSQIRASATEAAMRLFVVDPEAGPIPGIVIKLTGPTGTGYYTGETDTEGYAEVLVPVGQHYRLEYLSLGRSTTSAEVDVPEGPNQDIRLTLRYRRMRPAASPAPTAGPAPAGAPAPAAPEPERLVLEGVLFATDSATLDPSSGPRLDRVVEYLVHHPRARVRIGGHTDNVGNPRHNQQLAEARASSVRDYLVAHGVDAARLEAVGYGDTQPVASNDTPEGRTRNRRIEATEVP